MDASPEIKKYFKRLDQEVKHSYEVASKARGKGLDPEKEVNIPLAKNMAERVVGLISVIAPQIVETNLPERINKLEKEYGLLDWRVGFKVAVEVAQETFCKFKDKQEAIEIGIRVGFAYLTLGIVSAPLEGFIGLKIKKRKDGKEYFALQYAGPIRGAGGTAASTSVILGDYVRVQLGYAPYDPEEIEINRYNTEVHDYHDRVTNLQYHPSDDELKFMVKHLPVEVDGDPTEKFEVSNYKDLPRIDTNLIRGGMALVLAEGLCQKAPKLWKRLSKWGQEFGLEWDWLKGFLELKEKIHAKHSGKKEKNEEKKTVKPNNTFIMDLVAGRPILTHPLAEGGFRLRYGRTRTSGFSAAAVHPATLIVLEKYIAIGTQLKVERPGKAATITLCDSIDGPIVKLNDGSVVYCDSEAKAKEVYSKIVEVIFLGDFLFNYGDFSENGHSLVPCGYCSEWWSLELEKALKEKNDKTLNEKFEGYIKNPFKEPLFEETTEISTILGIPLHPSYTFYWKLLSEERINSLISWFKQGRVKKTNEKITKLVFPYREEDSAAKRVLELLGVPHLVINKENVVIEGDWGKAVSVSLAFNSQEELELLKPLKGKNGLEIVNKLSKFTIRDKAGTFIGARMGRPEKAKMRTMTGSPQVMFPVGEEGDRLRSFQAALQNGKVNSAFPLWFCDKCEKETIYPICKNCDSECTRKFHCRVCGIVDKENCRHGLARPYRAQDLDIKSYFQNALDRIGERTYPDLIKGIRGTSNKNHVVEHLSKGILRAKHSIYVNKDGTTRYDCTELPITHFKPKEIKTSLERLKELGYNQDIEGNPLTSSDQILELRPQDVILPGFDSLDESAPKVLSRVAKFIDNLLVKFYGLESFYNIKHEEDLVGHLVIGLAPHISAGLIGRIIGFSETQGLLTHPMYHAGLRRDCVHPKMRFLFKTQLNNLFHYSEIGPLVEKLIMSGMETTRIDSFGTLRVECDQKYVVYGVDPLTRKVVEKEVKYFIKGPIPKTWINFKTATNRLFICTPTHDFLCVNNKKFQLKKAKLVKEGDSLPLLSKLKIKTKNNGFLNIISEFCSNLPEKELENIVICNEFFFRDLVKKHGRNVVIKNIGKEYQRKNLYEWYKQVSLVDVKKLLDAKLVELEDFVRMNLRIKYSTQEIPVILPLNGDLAALLGYYAAEGYSRKTKTVSQISFRINERDLQDEIIYLIKKVFGLRVNLGESNSKITICSQLIYGLFVYVFKVGSTAYEKRVPSLLWNFSEKNTLRFISSYLDGDGTVGVQQSNFIFYSVSRKLLDGVAQHLSRFGIFSKYFTTGERSPGKTVLEKYKSLNREPKKHVLHHLIINGPDCNKLKNMLMLKSSGKKEKLKSLKIRTKRTTVIEGKKQLLEEDKDLLYDFVKEIKHLPATEHSYCLEVEHNSNLDKNILWGEQIVNFRCDGDEAAVMLLMDALLNFSRQYLPERRGAKTMDSPLVLTSTLYPSEVDDQVHGMDVVWKYPLELYEAAQEMKNPWDVKDSEGNKVTQLGKRLGTSLQYEDFGFTHSIDNFNKGVQCSAYKIIPSMAEKLMGQMDIAQKVRAVDMDDVAKLVIQKHFLRDIKGNLRKFSMQQFRCVKCNEKYRRPPLTGNCTNCKSGRLIFTISYGSVVKYLEPSLKLAEKYDFSPYLKQTLKILEMNADMIFGREKEKQVGLGSFVS